MKKITLLFAFALTLGISGTYAQSCAKSCAKTADAKEASIDTEAAEAASKLASMDEAIDEKVCPVSGKVSYVRTVKNDDGNEAFEDVQYDVAKGAFVNVSPKDMEANCSAGKKMDCCASKDGTKSMKKADTKKTKADRKKS